MFHDAEARAAAVFTYKSRATIARDHGTQSWRLDPKRIATFNYVIMARCRTQYEAEDALPHGTAFMIGRVLDIVPSTEPHNMEGRGGHRRWLFRISEAAPLNIAGFWRFGRWTTIVRSLTDFGINPADYDFQPLETFLDDADKAALAQSQVDQQSAAERARRSVSEIIAEHKTGISHEVGVPVEQIDISIRF